MKISLSSAYPSLLTSPRPLLQILGPLLLGTAFFMAAPAHAQTDGISRGSIVALTNADRADNGLGSVTEDAALNAAAQKKANDMVANGYFAHVSPSGVAPWYWFKSVGYYYYTAGENLAVDFASAESVNQAWMNSPTHRANIMNGAFTRIGIGMAEGTYNGKPVTYFVQFFAKPYIPKTAQKKTPIRTTLALPRRQTL